MENSPPEIQTMSGGADLGAVCLLATVAMNSSSFAPAVAVLENAANSKTGKNLRQRLCIYVRSAPFQNRVASRLRHVNLRGNEPFLPGPGVGSEKKHLVSLYIYTAAERGWQAEIED
jgi:hypothetical protein